MKKTEHGCRDGKKQRVRNWEREDRWWSEERRGTAVGRGTVWVVWAVWAGLGGLGGLGWMEGERVEATRKSGGRMATDWGSAWL